MVKLNLLLEEEDQNAILELAQLFEAAIDTINQEIATQFPTIEPPDPGESEPPFVSKMIHLPHLARAALPALRHESPEEPVPDLYEVEIDDRGVLYLRKRVRLPLFGQKCELHARTHAEEERAGRVSQVVS